MAETVVLHFTIANRSVSLLSLKVTLHANVKNRTHYINKDQTEMT